MLGVRNEALGKVEVGLRMTRYGFVRGTMSITTLGMLEISSIPSYCNEKLRRSKEEKAS